MIPFVKLLAPLLALAGDLVTAQASDSVGRVETLHGVQMAANSASFQVVSQGCTKASSFVLHTDKGNLQLRRIKTDRCRRRPILTWVEIPLPEPGTHWTLSNPFAVPEGVLPGPELP